MSSNTNEMRETLAAYRRFVKELVEACAESGYSETWIVRTAQASGLSALELRHIELL